MLSSESFVAACETESRRACTALSRLEHWCNARTVSRNSTMPTELYVKAPMDRASEQGKRVFLSRVISKRDREMRMLEVLPGELATWKPTREASVSRPTMAVLLRATARRSTSSWCPAWHLLPTAITVATMPGLRHLSPPLPHGRRRRRPQYFSGDALHADCQRAADRLARCAHRRVTLCRFTY